MLQKFTVKGFKNFETKIEFDLKSGNYSFNNSVVKNNILRTAVIYGDNASGKSNLGLAIMDIITHLTDNEKNSDDYATIDQVLNEVLNEYEKRKEIRKNYGIRCFLQKKHYLCTAFCKITTN